MISADALVKRYRSTVAVGGIDFTVEPGQVTGFLGPNGAGKSTTMRMVVGLDRPTEGVVTVNGRRYKDHRAPLREVGVLLDAKAAHRGRTAYKHLLSIAATHGIGAARVREVLGVAGLDSVAGKRIGGFSLGMGQRLGIAAALLGDPATIILDEPVNGLDPEGVRWVRMLMKSLAAEGRTVLLSSHLMSEMAQTADHLIVIGRGRILADGPIGEVIGEATRSVIRVRTRQAPQLMSALSGAGTTVSLLSDDALEISGQTAESGPVRRRGSGRTPSGRRMARLGAPAMGGVMSTKDDIRVLLVDDQELVRYGFRLMLDAAPGVLVVGEAGDGAQAIGAAERLRPDVVLMDIRMPGVGGIEATIHITRSLPDTRVLALTTYDLDDYAFGALGAGAAGFLLKDTRPDDLVAAIRAVHAGDAMVSPRITAKLIEAAAPHLGTRRNTDADDALAVLTAREREIFVLIGLGHTNGEIAASLHLSDSTVKAHVGRVLAKLDLRNRVEAVIRAYELGVVGR